MSVFINLNFDSAQDIPDLKISLCQDGQGMTMSTGSRGSGHFSQYSTASGQSGSSHHSDHISELTSDEPESDASVQTPHTYRERTQAWWSVGEYLENGHGAPLTHQSAKFTLTGNRVFANYKEELWDLSDSLMELYEANQTANLNATLQIAKKGKHLNKHVDVREWLMKDTTHGFIRVYAPETDFSKSQLIPCTLSTSAHKICLMLGISLNALHVQLNGDIIRRLDPYEHPLVLQNEYLAGLGYNDISRIQNDGVGEDLGYLIRFYAGKPYHDSTFSRNQLQAYIDIRKGKVIHQWTRRLCVISGTRLLIYKDKMKRSRPTVVQLAKGAVEEVKFKGHDLCLKLTSTLQGERSIYLSFVEVSDYNRWYRKCKKATDKLPTSADLSNCHLEFLPETIFINDQLSMLNLRHNVLKERPIEEDIYTIGWIDDIPRFNYLRSLNLADNNLVNFPLSLCFIKTLVELNIASNKLTDVPPEIAELTNLQALHIHNNHLAALPDEMVALRKLFILVLAFNHFTAIPAVVANMTDVRVSEVENIIMAGNQIERFTPEILAKMKYVKKVDLRMNLLSLTPSETMKFTTMEHLTHLDIRDNRITDLDIRGLKSLEYLNCERNNMISLQINGSSLKNLFAANNDVENLQISPKPEWLLQIDVSHNQLSHLPEFLSDCFFLQKLYAGHNNLIDIPSRMFLDAKKLKSLRINHNKLPSLPPEVDTMFIEEFFVQHNKLAYLPEDFLAKANKLRVFNATKNRLTSLCPLNDNQDLNKVQELYLTANNFTDSVLSVIAGYPRLKVLHLAQNEIHELHDSDIERLEMLQELNISGNQLRSLPAALGRLTKLVSLRAHTNLLSTLPDFHQATSLRVLDVGHNQLLNVSVTSLMASQINLLDMSLNAQLKVDPQEFRSIRNRKTVCLVDLTGQNRKLPGLDRPQIAMEETDELDPSLPWKAGFSETSGTRNKLCVATLKVLRFGSENDAVFAMFDGGHNNEVPKILLDHIPSLLQYELQHERTADKYMKYTMLAAHRKLEGVGQRLGASGLVSHIRRMASNQMNQYTLNLANVGDVEAVLCRRGDAVLLTKKFTTTSNKEECYRAYKSDGIITEDSKVNGTTKNTRLLGCAFLYPHVIPDPYTNIVTLRHDDEFIIIANRGLWKFVDYDEAVHEIYDIGNPVVAAKKLQDLAQGYGSKENIAVLVIRLNTDSQPSLGRLRKNRSMSIDDVEAAAQHQARKQEVPDRLRASTGKIKRLAPVVPVPVIQSEPLPEPQPGPLPEPQPGPLPEPQSPAAAEEETGPETIEYVRAAINVDGSPIPGRKSPSRTPHRSPVPALRPLPNQRYRKKNIASDWDSILQKRLADEVKDKEMKHLSQTIGDSDDELDMDRVTVIDLYEPHPDIVDGELGNWTSSLKKKDQMNGSRSSKIGSIGRSSAITTPWTDTSNLNPNTANPAYSHTQEVNEHQVITMTSNKSVNKERPRVSKMIGMFENINRASMAGHEPSEVRRSFRGRTRDSSASRDRSQSREKGFYMNGESEIEPEVPIYTQIKKVRPHRAPPRDKVPQSYSRDSQNETVIVEIARL